jgi:HPt (histidine-containing phosphotransfer) domain-containing protein
MTSRSETRHQIGDEAWTPPDMFRELQADGSGEVVAELIAIFESDTASRLQQLRVAIANADFKLLRAEAHTIKGTASQLGAGTMASLCQELESADTEIALSEIGQRVGRLETQFAEVCHELARYRNSYPLVAPLLIVVS